MLRLSVWLELPWQVVMGLQGTQRCVCHAMRTKMTGTGNVSNNSPQWDINKVLYALFICNNALSRQNWSNRCGKRSLHGLSPRSTRIIVAPSVTSYLNIHRVYSPIHAAIFVCDGRRR